MTLPSTPPPVAPPTPPPPAEPKVLEVKKAEAPKKEEVKIVCSSCNDTGAIPKELRKDGNQIVVDKHENCPDCYAVQNEDGNGYHRELVARSGKSEKSPSVLAFEDLAKKIGTGALK